MEESDTEKSCGGMTELDCDNADDVDDVGDGDGNNQDALWSMAMGETCKCN